MKYKHLLILILILSACTSTKINVTNISDIKELKNDILIYSLPRTVLQINVEIKQTIIKKGPYCDYAKKYLGIENIPLKDASLWEISDIKINSYPTVDSTQHYAIESKGIVLPNYITLTENGLLHSINSFSFNNSDFNQKTNLKLETKQSLGVIYKDLSDKRNYTKGSNKTLYKTVKTDSSFIRVPVDGKEIEQKTIEDKAAEASHFIIRLRKRRFKLIAGIYDKFYEGEALKTALQELNRLEEEYLSLFIGKTFTKTNTTNYEFTPDEININTQNLLFRFSSTKGIVPNNDLRGHPIIIEINKSENTSCIKTFINQQNELSKKTPKETGLYYRIPEKATVNIINSNDIIAQKELLIAQYGTHNTIPVDILKKENINILFNTKFGSLISIKQQYKDNL